MAAEEAASRTKGSRMAKRHVAEPQSRRRRRSGAEDRAAVDGGSAMWLRDRSRRASPRAYPSPASREKLPDEVGSVEGLEAGYDLAKDVAPSFETLIRHASHDTFSHKREKDMRGDPCITIAPL
jgi:hypothetical protein